MKGPLVIPALTLCLCFPAASGFCAELTGRIVVAKKLIKKQVTLPAYQLRGAPATAVSDDHGESANEFGSVAVYLEGQLLGPEKPIRVELEQAGQRFEPELVVIPVGSSVSFPNGDPIFHNVFSLSGAKKFDLGYYPAGQTRIVKFDEPGVVQVYCHLHPNMYAAIVVVPNRWYAKPRDDGTFIFHDVPPGTYHLVAWHMNAGFFRREVHVASTGGTDVVIHIPVRDGERGR
jgi:plastocyanin